MSPVADGALLAVEGLTKTFDLSPPLLQRLTSGGRMSTLRAVDGVDFAIARGRTLALVGESGCGKSTVARLVVGLHRPSAGRVLFEGIDLADLRSRAAQRPFRRRMQMIFQDPYASLNPRWRVEDIVAEPIRAFGLARDRADLREQVAELLLQVGLSPADGAKYPHEFSGGQRQRISIARALSSRPEFLVADEPTSALDVSVQAQILNLMKELQRDLQLTFLFISHNLAVVDHVADDVGVMYLGRIVEHAPATELFHRPRHPYTRLLLDTLPDLTMSRQRGESMRGEVPSPIDPPPGCAFHPRCPFADARCRSERPALRADGMAMVACHGIEEGRIPPPAPRPEIARAGA